MQDRSEEVPELETAVCPLCESGSAAASRYAQPPYRVVRCSACGLWYLNPRVRADVASAYYESDDYFAGGEAGYGDYSVQEQSLRAGFRALLVRLERLGATGGRLLEVGCGYGYFLDECREHFVERIGVEMSPAAARAAAELSGATVHSSIDEVPADARFDLVFASHVIEHVYEPVSFTKRLLRHLEPGGAIVYSTPDMGSLWRKLLGARWPSFKYPEHVAFFDGETLNRLFTVADAVAPRRIPVLDRFPASEILSKLGIPAPRFSARITVPLPATSVCVMARAPGESAT